MSQQIKRVYRSRLESQAAGVCAGLGIYLGIDPVVVRLAAVFATLVTGVVPGIVAYLAAWIIMPIEPAPVASRPTVEQTQQGPA